MTRIIPVRPFGLDLTPSPKSSSESSDSPDETESQEIDNLLNSKSSRNNFAGLDLDKSGTTGFKLDKITDQLYTIEPVLYRGVNHRVFLKTSLIGGVGLAFDQWGKHQEIRGRSLDMRARFISCRPNENDLSVASVPFYHAIFKTLFLNRENTSYAPQVEVLRQSIEHMLSDEVVTRSLVQKPLTPGGKYTLVHAPNTGLHWQVETHFFPIGFVRHVPIYTLECFLGAEPLAAVVYQWLVQKELVIDDFSHGLNCSVMTFHRGDKDPFNLNKGDKNSFNLGSHAVTLKILPAIGICAVGNIGGHYP